MMVSRPDDLDEAQRLFGGPPLTPEQRAKIRAMAEQKQKALDQFKQFYEATPQPGPSIMDIMAESEALFLTPKPDPDRN